MWRASVRRGCQRLQVDANRRAPESPSIIALAISCSPITTSLAPMLHQMLGLLFRMRARDDQQRADWPCGQARPRARPRRHPAPRPAGSARRQIGGRQHDRVSAALPAIDLDASALMRMPALGASLSITSSGVSAAHQSRRRSCRPGHSRSARHDPCSAVSGIGSARRLLRFRPPRRRRICAAPECGPAARRRAG